MSRSLFTATLLSCIVLVLAFCCQLTIAQEETTTTTSTKLVVYHQKDGEYIKRGEIVGLPGAPEYVAANNEVVSFKKESDVFYQVKVKDERTGNIILSTIKMCQMVASDWSDEFTLHLNEDNQFYYLSYYAGSNECPDNIEYPITTKPFTTRVNVVQAVPAPKPMLGNFGAQKAKPKTNKATAEVNDEVPDAKEIEEKTFFQKYWYVLLGGAFLIMSIGSGPEPAAPPAAPRR